MRTGRPKAPLSVTPDERVILLNYARRQKSEQRVSTRARIVLACAAGHDNKTVARKIGVNEHTVARWRARFVRDRLDGLTDETRPGAPRKITDQVVEDVITRT